MKHRILAWLLMAALLPGMLQPALAAEPDEDIAIGEIETEETASGEMPEDHEISIALSDDAAQTQINVSSTDTLALGVSPRAKGVSVADTGIYSTTDSGFVNQLGAESAAVYRALETAFSSGAFTCNNGAVTVELAAGSDAVNKLNAALAKQSFAGDVSKATEAKEWIRKRVCDAYAAYNYDHPEVFWLGNRIDKTKDFTVSGDSSGYTAQVNSLTLSISSLFSNQTALNTAKANFDTALNAAVAAAQKGTSNYQKLRLAHDFLCSAVTYTAGAARERSAYGALVDKKCVCEGYSRALKAICDRLGIPCVCVGGSGKTASGSVEHMWNVVCLSNRWYAVDATWDDTATGTVHTFFLVGSGTAAAELGLGKFSATHVSSGRLYDDTSLSDAMTFAYPVLDTAAYTGEHVVDSLKLTGDSTIQLTAGQKKTIGATVYPESASGIALSWKTSNKKVATVSGGTITAVGAGTAVITATADGITASCTVKVIPKLSTPKLTTVATRVGGILVRWNCVSGATGYRICRRTSGSSWSGTQIATVSGATASEYIDYSVKNNTKYTYTVYALYDGVTASSCSKNGKSAYYLKTPEILTISNKSSGIKLTWKSISKATGYNVYRKSPKDTKWTKLATLGAKATSYTDKKASNGKSYIYTLRAVNSKGMSYYHTAGSRLRRIHQVKWSSLRSTSKKTLTARWKRVSSVTGYELQYSTKSSMEKATTVKIKAGTASTLGKTVKKLSGGKKYYVRIRAYKTLEDGKNYGAWSGVKSIKIKK
ncbi:MAG: fibronectin type III domain-containing protein [Eubacteriales bacterium]|nr:fibronectin type III domain-containing protein [Eubacteriales bacterium]